MGTNKAMRSRCSSRASNVPARDNIWIIARCALFCAALMAVPTLMSALKCMGVW